MAVFPKPLFMDTESSVSYNFPRHMILSIFFQPFKNVKNPFVPYRTSRNKQWVRFEPWAVVETPVLNNIS